MKKKPIFKIIAINKLIPHPLNPNEMNEASYDKLKSNIQKTGNYEAITIRAKGVSFEILNGYHRWCILKELGYSEVNCQIWDVDDTQAKLLLATLNRLKGTDDTKKRAILLADLFQEFNQDKELLSLIPESERAMTSLLKSIQVETADFDAETERGLVEEKLLQSGVDSEVAETIASNYKPPSSSPVFVLKFVFKDVFKYNRAIEYFGKKGNPDELLSLVENYGIAGTEKTKNKT